MATTLKSLEHRMEAMEREMSRLARLVEDPEEQGPPMDGSVDEWLARLRERSRPQRCS